MAKSKAKTVFFCKECGYETPKWMGQCPGCHQWNDNDRGEGKSNV